MNVRLLPLVLSLVTTALHAENWSNWRGPLHNGSSPEKNLPASFSKTEGVKWSVEMPGASAAEVENRVTRPMEKFLWEIPGVEYLYATSSPGAAMVIVRFTVGTDIETALVRVQN